MTDKDLKKLKRYSNNLLFEYGRFYVKIDNLYMDSCIYRDLETEEYFYYSPYFVYKKINTISISPGNEKEFENKNFEFEQLRQQFFERLLIEQEEEVSYELVKNNKQLVKGRKHELLF